MPNPPFITATTAAQVPQQKDDQLDTEEQNESGKKKPFPRSMHFIRYYPAHK